MLRRFLFRSVGALMLLAVLGAPGQLHAQHMRGGMSHAVHPSFRGRFMPGFRGGFDPRFFNGRTLSPRFNRFDRFEDRFERRFNHGRFDRFEDRFERRFNHGFFDPRFSPGFGPLFFMPF